MGEISDMLTQGEEYEIVRKWKCKDGTIINVEEMTNEHLKNAYRYLLRIRGKTKESLDMLKEEAKNRGIKLLKV